MNGLLLTLPVACLLYTSPFFSIILSLVCAVISFAAGEKRARQLTVFLLTASVIMQASLLAYCARNHTSYAYMMGHYPAPWGNEITAGVLEPLMALLFAAVMLCSVVGGFTRILRDVAPRRRTLYWVVVDLAHVSLIALCYTCLLYTSQYLRAELPERAGHRPARADKIPVVYAHEQLDPLGAPPVEAQAA